MFLNVYTANLLFDWTVLCDAIDLEDLRALEVRKQAKADHERKFLENQEAIRIKRENKLKFQEEER